MKKKSMKYSWLIKLNFLLLALGVVIYAIYRLNTQEISFEIIGVPKAAPTSAESAADSSANPSVNPERKARLVSPAPDKASPGDENKTEGQ